MPTSKYNSAWLDALRALTVEPHGYKKEGDQSYTETQKVLDTLPEDLIRLEEHAHFIFECNLDAKQRTALTFQLLKKWHKGEDGQNGEAPSLVALCMYAAHYLGCEQEFVSQKLHFPLLVAALLADNPNALPYHNPLHFKKVLLQTIRMIAAHNVIFNETRHVFNAQEICLLLVAACVHDLGHDGMGNTLKGVFEQGRLEKQSFGLAAPHLRNAGMDDDALRALQVMILCTDVSPIGDLTSPVNQLKAAYRYHYMEDRHKSAPLNLSESIEALETNARLALLAMILHEADVATSAGVTYAVTRFETVIHQQEIGVMEASPQDILDFLSDICRRRFLTDSGQWLYAGNMARIYALAEADVLAGNEVFTNDVYPDAPLSLPDGRDSLRTLN